MEVMPGYKQTEVGVIPEEWDAKQVAELCEYQNGTSLEHLFTNDDGLKVISIGNYSVTGSYVDNGVHINRKYRKEVEKFILRRNDLTMSLNDKTSVGAIIGRVLLIPEDDLYVFNQRTMRLRPKSNVSPSYLHYAINADRVHGTIVGLAKPGTQIYINTDDVIELKLPVPPLPEQRAIATVLSDVDALLNSLDPLIAKKRDLKQAAMQKLLTGQTRLPGFSGDWVVKRLDAIADIRSGGTPSTVNPQFWDGVIPWCTPTDITALRGKKHLSDTARMITPIGLKASSAEMIPAQSVIMTSRATIGECAINNMPVCTNQGFKNFIPFLATDVDFLYYLLGIHKQGFISLCSGSTFLEIGKTQLAAYELRLPTTKAEQVAIAQVLSEMDVELEALEQRRKKTADLKQGILQELLTGRTRLV
jgi:type I restriction enzyme S subunit